MGGGLSTQFSHLVQEDGYSMKNTRLVSHPKVCHQEADYLELQGPLPIPLPSAHLPLLSHQHPERGNVKWSDQTPNLIRPSDMGITGRIWALLRLEWVLGKPRTLGISSHIAWPGSESSSHSHTRLTHLTDAGMRPKGCLAQHPWKRTHPPITNPLFPTVWMKQI